MNREEIISRVLAENSSETVKSPEELESMLNEELSKPENEIDYDLDYTAYDICMMVMTLPERKISGMPAAYVTPLAKACGKAPYCKYDKPVKKASIKLAV